MDPAAFARSLGPNPCVRGACGDGRGLPARVAQSLARIGAARSRPRRPPTAQPPAVARLAERHPAEGRAASPLALPPAHHRPTCRSGRDGPHCPSNPSCVGVHHGRAHHARRAPPCRRCLRIRTVRPEHGSGSHRVHRQAARHPGPPIGPHQHRQRGACAMAAIHRGLQRPGIEEPGGLRRLVHAATQFGIHASPDSPRCCKGMSDSQHTTDTSPQPSV